MSRITKERFQTLITLLFYVSNYKREISDTNNIVILSHLCFELQMRALIWELHYEAAKLKPKGSGEREFRLFKRSYPRYSWRTLKMDCFCNLE